MEPLALGVGDLRAARVKRLRQSSHATATTSKESAEKKAVWRRENGEARGDNAAG